MRRISFWLLSTITVLVLLFGYHTSTSSALNSLSTVAQAPVTGSDTTSSATSTTPSTSSGGTSTTSTTTSGSKTVTGSVAQTQWGPVQVQITTSGGKITAVTVPQYPNGNPRDEEINSSALPILVQNTLNAQSADIDMVSGATVTSTGYEQSLQSAIDKAGL